MIGLNRRVQRETPSRSLPRAIIVELEPPNFIRLREKGRRKSYETTTEALYTRLVKDEADGVRQSRKKSRRRR